MKKRIIYAFLLFSFSLSALPSEQTKLFFALHQKRIEQAVTLYHQYCAARPEEAGLLASQMAMLFLRQAIRSEKEEERIIALHAASVVGCQTLLPIFEEGILDKDPRVQVIALKGLKKLQSDTADHLILKAIASENPAVALAAAGCLMEEEHEDAVMHLEALVYKVPAEMRIVFPALFGLSRQPAAQRQMVELLNDRQLAVRIYALDAVLNKHLDYALPEVRLLAERGTPIEKELAVQVLGEFKDLDSIPLIESLLVHSDVGVRLSAAIALYQLAQKGESVILKEASAGNSWAICALGKISQGEQFLQQAKMSPDPVIRTAALWARLERKEEGCLDEVVELLERPKTAVAFFPSLSGALVGFKMGASDPIWQEKWMAKIAELPLPSLLKVTKALLHSSPKGISLLFDKIEKSTQPQAVDFLHHTALTSAARPYIRLRAQIALARQQQEGEVLQDLQRWLRVNQSIDLNFGLQEKSFPKEEERTELFISAMLTVAEIKRADALPFFIQLFADSSSLNRPLIAAIICLVTQ